MFPASAERQPTPGWTKAQPQSAHKGSKNKNASNWKCQRARAFSPATEFSSDTVTNLPNLSRTDLSWMYLAKTKPKDKSNCSRSPGSIGSALTPETECHLLSDKWQLQPLIGMARNCCTILLKSCWKSALFPPKWQLLSPSLHRTLNETLPRSPATILTGKRSHFNSQDC